MGAESTTSVGDSSVQRPPKTTNRRSSNDLVASNVNSIVITRISRGRMSAAREDGRVKVTMRKAVLARPAEPSDTFSGNRDNTITFKHPGYPDQFSQNVLLTLFAFDSPTGGIHYGTAHLACAVVACNAWNGYFTRTRDGPRIDRDNDELLTERAYYFHVPTETAKYPVYPSFEHWAFPHDNLPPYWLSAVQPDHESDIDLAAPPSSSTLTAAVLRRDKSCLVTKQGDCIERAHLCPRSEVKWFELNGMAQYNLNEQLIQDSVVDDISNVLALRSDIHTTFDDRKFVIVPKDGQWVVHFTHLTRDLGRLYHNTPLKLHSDISARCLLIRFAWTIFPSVAKFLSTGAGRMVRMRVTVDDEIREITKRMGPEGAKDAFATTRGRSTSPKKRKESATADSRDNANILAPAQHAAKRRRVLPATPPKDVSSATAASSPPPADPPRLHTSPETIANQSSETTDHPFSSSQPTSNDSPSRNHTGSAEPRAQYFQKLKRSWLRHRRPSDPSLYCCDYNAAEAAAEAGVPGKREWGGGWLCEECLGVEYRDEDDDE